MLAKIGITYLRKGKFHQLHMDQMMIQLIEMLVKFIPYQSRQELIHEHNKDDVFASLAQNLLINILWNVLVWMICQTILICLVRTLLDYSRKIRNVV